jgi:hypothetical protein
MEDGELVRDSGQPAWCTSGAKLVQAATFVHFVAEFAGGVDVRAIPAADVVFIVKELAAIGSAIARSCSAGGASSISSTRQSPGMLR